MTRFAEPSFTVAALPSKEYADNYERTFTKTEDGKACTACDGAACPACEGTGLRAWQQPA